MNLNSIKSIKSRFRFAHAFLATAVIMIMCSIMAVHSQAAEVDAADLGYGYILINSEGAALTDYTGTETLTSLGISYDSANQKLTLNNTKLKTALTYSIIMISGVDVTIECIGDNYLAGGVEGIYSDSNLSLTGTGSLTTSTEHNAIKTDSQKSLSITDVTLNLSTTYSYATLIESGGTGSLKNLTINANGYKIFSASDALTVDNVTAVLTADYSAFYGEAGTCVIKDSNITLSGTNDQLCSGYPTSWLLDNDTITSDCAGNRSMISGSVNITIKETSIICTKDRTNSIVNSGSAVTIEDSTITAEEVTCYTAPVTSDDVLTIKSSKISAKGCYNLLYGMYGITISDSTICGSYCSWKGLNSCGAISITGSEVAITSSDDCINTSDTITIEKSTVSCSSSSRRGLSNARPITITDSDLTITSSDDCINTSDTITIEKSTVSCSSSSGNVLSNGGSITITDSDLSITSSDDCINTPYPITIEKSTLNCSSSSGNVLYNASPITITDSDLTITSSDDCIGTSDVVTIKGSTVNARNTADNDVINTGKNIIFEDSDVTLESAGNLVAASGDITIKGSTVKSEGSPAYGINAPIIDAKLAITDSTVEISALDCGIESGNMTISGSNISVSVSNTGSVGIELTNSFEMLSGHLIIHADSDDCTGLKYTDATTMFTGGCAEITASGKAVDGPISSFSVSDQVTLKGGNDKGDAVTKTIDEIGDLKYVEICCNHIDADGNSTIAEIKGNAATCTQTGITDGTYCTICGETIKEQEVIPATDHTCTTVTTKATTEANGSIEKKCSVCGTVVSTQVIYYPKTVSLKYNSCTYTGKAQKPAVTVTDNNGSAVASSNYTVAYKNNTNAGTATVTVTFKNNYSGTITKTFKIAQKKTSISVKVKSKSYKVAAVKSKAQTFAIGAKATSGGKLSFAKVSGSAKLSVNKTTGKITVKKKTAKGTYKLKIKVKSAATKNFKAATKTVTIKVKVK